MENLLEKKLSKITNAPIKGMRKIGFGDVILVKSGDPEKPNNIEVVIDPGQKLACIAAILSNDPEGKHYLKIPSTVMLYNIIGRLGRLPVDPVIDMLNTGFQKEELIDLPDYLFNRYRDEHATLPDRKILEIRSPLSKALTRSRIA
jgi:hypothetical protein